MVEVAQLRQTNAQLRKILRDAEAALIDISNANQEADCDLQWCETRAEKALILIKKSHASA